MSNFQGKPTLGYPSRTAAIFALKAQGKTEKQIAAELGMAEGSISSMIWKHRRRRAFIENAVPLTIDGNLRADLEREARKRGVYVPTLINQLLRAIVVDKLVSAVLDK
jgi:transcriptional regulator